MEKLQKHYAEIKLVTIDINNYITELVNHPDQHLLKELKQACYDAMFRHYRLDYSRIAQLR
jgi:hypothetical protein